MGDVEERLLKLLGNFEILLGDSSDSIERIIKNAPKNDGINTSISSKSGSIRQCYADLAEREYFERRERDKIFDLPGLFSDPVWDILLDLMSAKERGNQLSVTAVCMGSNAPSTTALRYLSVLEKNELVCRRPDVNDARRSWVELSEKGHRLMVRYFDRTNANLPKNAAIERGAIEKGVNDEGELSGPFLLHQG